MAFPEYSVLMSVYCKENPDWLSISIKAMLDQTVKPTEFVLVEDGPLTPELDHVIERYDRENPGLFKIVKLEKNGGLGPALKVGIENCSCEYVARMDSDDYCVPMRIEKELTAFIEDPQLGMVGTNVVEFIDTPEKCVAKVILPETHQEIVAYSKKRNPFRHPCILYKKSTVLAAGNYRSFPMFEDYDIFVRLIRSGCKCYNIQEFLVYMRVSPDFYQRRGGMKYLRDIHRFKKEQYRVGYFSYPEYIGSFVPHALVCMMPNRLRALVYKRLLRK